MESLAGQFLHVQFENRPLASEKRATKRDKRIFCSSLIYFIEANLNLIPNYIHLFLERSSLSLSLFWWADENVSLFVSSRQVSSSNCSKWAHLSCQVNSTTDSRTLKSRVREAYFTWDERAYLSPFGRNHFIVWPDCSQICNILWPAEEKSIVYLCVEYHKPMKYVVQTMRRRRFHGLVIC